MEEVTKKIEIDKAFESGLKQKNLKDGEYIETVGRRKTAAARVRIIPANKSSFIINGKALTAYFPTKALQSIAKDSLTNSKTEETKFQVSAVVKGGGSHAQAEAVRHGIARALVDFDADLRKNLKKLDFLKRDPRKKERKKFGLKGARRAPQWSKR